MELTLNLVWACLAAAAVLVLMASLSSNGARLRQPSSYALRVIAMGCALVILFFVISMTDDLHDQAILLEEKKPSRVVFEMANPAPPSAVQAVPFAFLLFVSFASFNVALSAVRRAIDPSRVLVAVSILPESLDGRAPPLSLS